MDVCTLFSSLINSSFLERCKKKVARNKGVLPQFVRFVRQEQSSSFSLLYRLYQHSVVEDGVTSRRRQAAAHDYVEADSITEGIGRRRDVRFYFAGSRN